MNQTHWDESYYMTELSAKKLQSLLTSLLETQLETPHSSFGILIIADQIRELTIFLGQLCSELHLSQEEKSALEQLSACLLSMKFVTNRLTAQQSEPLSPSEQIELLQEALQETRSLLGMLKNTPEQSLDIAFLKKGESL